MPEPYHIVDSKAAGPKELITQAPVPQLIALAGGGNRRELLHWRAAPAHLHVRGTALLAHLSTRVFGLLYGEDGNRAVIVVGDDVVHRAYSRGTKQSATALRTGRGCFDALDPKTPMFHATLAAGLRDLEIINADGSAGDTLRHLSKASRSSMGRMVSPQTLVAGLAMMGWLQQGVNPTVDMRYVISPRCAHGAKAGRYCYEGCIIITADGVFRYDEAKCFWVRLDVTVQANVFAACASQTVASSQHGFDLLHPAAATSAEAQALAALFLDNPTARTVNRSGVPSWFATERCEVVETAHLDEAQKLSALGVLDDAFQTCRSCFANPTAFWRSDARCGTYVQLCDSSPSALESPWFHVEFLSLKSLGLDGRGACTAAKLVLLGIDSENSPAHRSRARATALHLLGLFRGTSLWLLHVLAYMLWKRGGLFPVDGSGQVRLPPRLEEPSDLVRLARLLAQVLELLQMDARTTLDGEIDCVTLMHGLGYRSVVAYDGRVSEATLNQRTLAALFQWSPVPATVSDMATLDLVVTYGASVVETAIPA